MHGKWRASQGWVLHKQHWQASSDLQRSRKYSGWYGVAHNPQHPVNPISNQRNKLCILSITDIWVLLECTAWDVIVRVLKPDCKKKKTKAQVPSLDIKMGSLKLRPFLETKAAVCFLPSSHEKTAIRFLSSQMQMYSKYQDIFNVSPLHASPARRVETWRDSVIHGRTQTNDLLWSRSFWLYHCSTAMPFTASRQSRTNTASSPFVDTDILLQLDSTLSSKYTSYKNFYLSKQTSS